MTDWVLIVIMKHITKLTIGLIAITLVGYSKYESDIDIDLPIKIQELNQIFTTKSSSDFLNQIALSQIALNRLAEKITVEIVIPNVTTGGGRFSSAGSGVIIGKKGSTYYVLTAEHIFPNQNDYRVVIRSKKPGDAEEIQTIELIRRYPDQDLRVIRFVSLKNYEVAKVGEASQLNKNSQVYVVGWPSNENREGFQFTPAKVTNPRAGDNLTYQPTEESIYKGMSGGAVLNEAGQLVGIHTGLTEVGGDGKGVLISTFLPMAPPEVARVLVKPAPVASPSWPSPVLSPSKSRLILILSREGTLRDGDLVLPSDESVYDEHTFEGTEGQVVTVTLESPDFDTYLAVFSPTGQLLGEHDDVNQKNTNSQLTITLPVTGKYRVIVNSYDKTARGEYNLKVIQSEETSDL